MYGKHTEKTTNKQPQFVVNPHDIQPTVGREHLVLLIDINDLRQRQTEADLQRCPMIERRSNAFIVVAQNSIDEASFNAVGYILVD